MIDAAAKDQAIRSSGIPECLHVPTAAIDEAAIKTYVGDVVRVLASGTGNKALLVEVNNPPPIDARLPIWKLKGSSVFHCKMQVWVHIAYTRYRQAYQRAFPADDITDKILSHALNRRMAALLGFQYVRITPISRAANSSSGFSENWGVALYQKPEELAAYRRRGAFIRYADLSSLMLMLDLKLGGGLMDAVNEGQALLRPET
jgi:hypothetical protein